jgi:DNA-binding MarR family transcriptional regulator
MSAADRDSSTLIQEFLGSVRVFSQTVRITVEEPLLGTLPGGRLSFPQYKLLRLVAGTDGHSIGEVAFILGVSSAAASKGVEKLVRRRFLRRTEGKLDRRAMHLSLTETGQRAVQAYEDARDATLRDIFEETPVSDLRRAVELFDRLSASLVDFGADPEELCLQCGIYFRDKCVVRHRGTRKCAVARHKAKARATGAAAEQTAGHTGARDHAHS